MAEYLKIFSSETYSSGGEGFFADGKYRIEKARYANYDFRGKVPGKDGTGILTLSLELQPLDKDGEEAGESKMQYWSFGNDDFEGANKGRSLVYVGDKKPQIWEKSDVGCFMAHLLKAEGFDAAAFEEENDISLLDGLVAEFGKVPSPRTPKAPKPGEQAKEKKYPDQVIVITSISSKKKGKAAAKPKPAEKEEESGGEEDNDQAVLITKFLKTEMFPSDKAKNGKLERLQVRMKLRTWADETLGDADEVKAVLKSYNDTAVLKAALKGTGWSLGGEQNDQLIKG